MALLRIHEIGQPVTPYVQIARPDHWIKNVFVLPGILGALSFNPDKANLDMFDLLQSACC